MDSIPLVKWNLVRGAATRKSGGVWMRIVEWNRVLETRNAWGWSRRWICFTLSWNQCFVLVWRWYRLFNTVYVVWVKASARETDGSASAGRLVQRDWERAALSTQSSLDNRLQAANRRRPLSAAEAAALSKGESVMTVCSNRDSYCRERGHLRKIRR